MNKQQVVITYPSGATGSFPKGVSVEEVVQVVELQDEKYPAVAALVNNHSESLNYKIEINSSVDVVRLNSVEGTKIYRQSLCFLLTMASKALFPERRLVIGHSLGKGFFYYYDKMDEVPEEDLIRLKARMLELADKNLPIKREVLSYKDAEEYFIHTNQLDTVALLRHKNEPKVYTNSCDSFMDLYHGPFVPSTKMLKVFDIMNFKPGFLLRYFSTGKPGIVPPFEENPVLFSIYREYKSWGKILNMHCVGDLNERIIKRKVKEFIEINEALHNKKISYIADSIMKRSADVKLVLIAGPSSSGKTTFSKKLAIQLRVLGMTPVPVSIDNYFRNREEAPLDDEGKYDLESIKAIDIELLNEHVVALFEGKEVEVPEYDFVTGSRREKGKKLRLPPNAVLIFEGIHCLNDELTPHVAKNNKYKIYISALTQLNIDDHNRISTTENRLVRRMVRDYQFRGNSAYNTLQMWPSVRRGEDKNIFPYQNSADSAFNSALDYELSVLKVYAEPLLRTVKPDMEGYNVARRLLYFLDNFTAIPSSWVPVDSILREFIGEGSFKY